MSVAELAFFEKVQSEMNFDLPAYNQFSKKKDIEFPDFSHLYDNILEMEKSVLMRVPDLSEEELKIDKYNLVSELEKTMILHSHIIQDLQDLRIFRSAISNILDNLIGKLYHFLKFKNQYNLKTTKEIEVYLGLNPTYIQIRNKVKALDAQIEKSEENGNLLKNKVGFIRDYTKYKTQEMFNER
jgi:hypothetical protein